MNGKSFPRSTVLLAVLVAGCGASDEEEPWAPRDVEAEVNDNVSTVVNVSWTTVDRTLGYVQYGPDEDMELRTPLEGTKSSKHDVPLLGLKEDTEYFYRVVTWDGEDAAASNVASVRTGDLPVAIPSTKVEGEPHEWFNVVPSIGKDTSVLIIDHDGDIVWYHQDDRDLDFYRARISNDGKSVIYNAASVSGDPADNSEIVTAALDGSGSTSVPVPLLAHDFVQHPDGTIGAIAVEFRDFEGNDRVPAMEVKGNKIVEVDADGNIETVWTTWDCFDPGEDPGEDIDIGWSLANALDYDPEEDVYYVGMRNFSSIAKVNRSTGECMWVLGFVGSSFEFSEGSQRFLHQHQFQLLGDDRILVMDNDGSIGNESRVLEYELDFENMVATQVWSYVADPIVYTFVLGEPIRLLDGSTMVNWSAAGQMDLVNEDGEVTWKINTGAGAAFGFNTVVDSLYPDEL